MITNVICPDKQEYPLQECLKKCRMDTRCVPYVYAVAVSRQRHWKGKPSVTQLLNGTREAYLKLTKDYSVDLADHAFMLLGTGAHSKLENAENEAVVLREYAMEYENITGTLDLVERWNEGLVLIDHKTAGSYMVAKMLGLVETKVIKTDDDGKPIIKNGKPIYDKKWTFNSDAIDKFEYQMQLNMYRIMLKETLNMVVDKLVNFVIVRDGGTYVATNRGIDKKVYVIEQEILPDKIVIDYFLHKRDRLLEALDKNTMPPICDERENWAFRKCQSYCQVAKHCDYIKYMEVTNESE